MSGILDLSFNDPNGYILTSFNTNNDSRAETLVIQPDGKIVVGGTTKFSSPNANFALARYNSDGTLDTGFATGGLFVFSTFYDCYGTSVALQTDGKILFCGRAFNSSPSSIFLFRFNTDGTLDTTTFNSPDGYIITPALRFDTLTETYYDTNPSSVLQTSNGKIIVSGFIFENSTGMSVYALVKYNSDGTYDTTFGTNGLGAVAHHINPLYYEYGQSMAIQNNGKIVLGGKTILNISTGYYSNFSAARFNIDGSIDTSFGTNGSVILNKFFPGSNDENDDATSVKIQTDGKIVLSGFFFVIVNFVYGFYFALARLTTSGSLDSSFGTGGIVYTNPSPSTLRLQSRGMELQTNGKIVIGGRYDFNIGSIDYAVSFALARYNTDGTLDTDFGTSGDGLILYDINNPRDDDGKALGIQTDGKIVMCGRSALPGDMLYDLNFMVARYLYFPDLIPPTPPTPTPIPPTPVPITSICFPSGTPILTDQGNIPIEKINPSIHTIYKKPIIAVTQTYMNDDDIVCIEKHSFEINIPNKTTYITKNHGIMYKNQLISAKKFVNKIHGVYLKRYSGELLYNILMEKHYVINVNNIMVETLNPKNIVAKLYTNNYSSEEKTKLILKINKYSENNNFTRRR